LRIIEGNPVQKRIELDRLCFRSCDCLGFLVLTKRRCFAEKDKRSPIIGMVKGMVRIRLRKVLLDGDAKRSAPRGEAPDVLDIEPAVPELVNAGLPKVVLCLAQCLITRHARLDQILVQTCHEDRRR
jgi:hypothetical protein